MLAGEPPFTGPTAQAIVAKRLSEPAPSVRGVRPSVPEAVDEAIRKALAPVAADRFATAGRFAQALQTQPTRATPLATAATQQSAPSPAAARPLRHRPVALLVLGFLLGLGVLFGWLRRHGGAPATPRG